jgi:hypothetical protein
MRTLSLSWRTPSIQVRPLYKSISATLICRSSLHCPTLHFVGMHRRNLYAKASLATLVINIKSGKAVSAGTFSTTDSYQAFCIILAELESIAQRLNPSFSSPSDYCKSCFSTPAHNLPLKNALRQNPYKRVLQFTSSIVTRSNHEPRHENSQ